MICEGQSVFTGETIELEFGEVISRIDPVLGKPPDDVYLAPGFIDLQVNGFAGVDYNSPTVPLEDIGGSVRALHSTGVTRFFPTVITGPPEAMIAALRN